MVTRWATRALVPVVMLLPLLGSNVSGAQKAAPPSPAAGPEIVTPGKVVVRAGRDRRHTFVPPPRHAARKATTGPADGSAGSTDSNGPSVSLQPGPTSAVASATINVTYDADFTPEARAAFQYAADIWASSISSPVPIEIDARWDPLASGVLGQAGATVILRDASAPASSWYPVALWNARRGSDACTPAAPCNEKSSDIEATFSSSYSNWYFGTDGATPAGKFDFVTVVLHEIGHGLGMSGSMKVSSGQGSWGYGTGYPNIYDRFSETGAGTALLDAAAFPNPSAALGSALQSGDVFTDSPEAVAANGGTRPKLYAPNPYEDGSSYSHWDEATYPAGDVDSLLTPKISPAEANHAPGPLTLGWFRDLGWTTIEPEPAPCAAVSNPVAWWKGENDLAAQTGPALSGSAGYGAGVVGRAFVLDGDDLVFTDSLPATTTGVAVEAWVKPTRTARTQAVASRWTYVGGEGDDVFSLFVGAHGGLLWLTDEHTLRRPVEVIASAPDIFDGGFHHIAATWSGSTVELYVDGALAASQPSPGGALNPGDTTQFRLGSESGPGDPFFFAGAIDEPAVYDRPLTADDVAAIHAAGSSGKCV